MSSEYNRSTKYNHAFVVAFSVDSDDSEGNVTEEELYKALIKRANDLKDNKELIEAIGAPYDTYEYT